MSTELEGGADRRGLRRRPLLALPVALGLAGCAGPSNLPEDIAVLAMSVEGLSPAAAALLEEAQRHARTRIGAAAVGGGAGVLAGMFGGRASGGGTASGTVSAAAGGIGTVLGYAYGEYLAARSARANMDSEKVRQLTAAAEADVTAYRRTEGLVRQVAEEGEAALLRLEGAAAAAERPAVRRQARNLSAGLAASRQARREIQATGVLLAVDLQEINDVEAIGRSRLGADELRRQEAAFRAIEEALGRREQVLEAALRRIPPGDRPAGP